MQIAGVFARTDRLCPVPHFEDISLKCLNPGFGHVWKYHSHWQMAHNDPIRFLVSLLGVDLKEVNTKRGFELKSCPGMVHLPTIFHRTRKMNCAASKFLRIGEVFSGQDIMRD